MTGRALCQAASCRRGRNGSEDEVRRAGEGWFLCPACLDRLKRDILCLPSLYNDCVKSKNSKIFHEIAKNSRKNTSDLMQPAAAEIRGNVRKVLASWASLVADERQVEPPTRDIPILARFLVRHAEWLAAHPAVIEMVDEIGNLTRSARNTADPNGAGRVHVGYCPSCDGELVALMRNSDDAHPSEIMCTASPDHVWPAKRWAALARAMRRNQAGNQGD